MPVSLRSPRQELPESFSYRGSGLLSPIKEQGDYDTCNLHAVLALFETKLRMKEQAKKKKKAVIGSLSVEHVLDLFVKDLKYIESNKVSVRVKNFITSHGVVFEEDYGLEGKKGMRGAYAKARSKDFEAKLKKDKVKLIRGKNLKCLERLEFTTTSFNETLKRQLISNGPIVVAFKERTDFVNLARGEISKGPYRVKWSKDGEDFVWHACLLVGWGRKGQQEYFELQNSQGPKWSDDGFGWISVDDVEEAYLWDVKEKFSL